jgi:hypothetical protein
MICEHKAPSWSFGKWYSPTSENEAHPKNFTQYRAKISPVNA